MTRLSHLEVENFMRLTRVSFPIRRGVTEISGRNASGKTSTINALAVFLDGLKVAPAEPIHDGAERCRIRGRIGEMDVIRHIETGKGGKLTTKIQFQPVADGKKPYPATQAQLSDLIGEHALDPLDFLKLDAKGMLKAFQVFVPGFDFAQAKIDHDKDYDRRTEVNRVAKESRAAAGLIIVPAITPDEPIDESALVKKLQDAGEQNARITQKAANRRKVAEDAARLREEAKQLEANWTAVEANIKKTAAEAVEDLRKQIAAIEIRIQRTEAEAAQKLANDHKWVTDTALAKNLEAQSLEDQLAQAGVLPTIVDTSTITAEINSARQTNEAIKRKAERAKHIATAEKYEAESQGLTESIKARDAAKTKAIAEAKLPLDNLDFVDGELRLNGQLFEQASMAEKLTLALAYTVRRNPNLRLAWIRDASLLDDEAFQRVEKLAEEFDCDVWLETVRPIGKNAIVLEDGQVKSIPAEEAA